MKGDLQSFDSNWANRPEALYTHWTAGEIQNQIQLAFRQHFMTFEAIYNRAKDNVPNAARDFLEIGAGRGSLSSYYAQKGDRVTVSDLSHNALQLAKNIFEKNHLKASFEIVDSENIHFPDNSFDICASIGLLEHFSDPKNVINEQFKILKNGGFCFAYIVPEKKSTINDEYRWLNEIVQSYNNTIDPENTKEEVYRTNYNLNYYEKIFREVGFEIIESSGIYPLPMISASPEFPFTLLNSASEKSLVKYFEEILVRRERAFDLPWLCQEDEGNAILIVGKKTEK